MAEYQIKAPLDLDDGQHTGIITKAIDRPVADENKYHYLDLWIGVDGTDGAEIKYGLPANVSTKTKLGKLLIAFGAVLKAGENINPDTYLLNKRCKFMSIKKDEFTNVVEGSIKPEIETIKV